MSQKETASRSDRSSGKVADGQHAYRAATIIASADLKHGTSPANAGTIGRVRLTKIFVLVLERIGVDFDAGYFWDERSRRDAFAASMQTGH